MRYDYSLFLSKKFLPLAAYQYQLIDLILLWSFLRMLAMLIQKRKEKEKYEGLIFQYIFLRMLNTSASNNVSLRTY